LKLLVARTDRLGDVVLSLPVFAYLKQVHPDWEIQALVAPASVPLVENDPHIDAIWTYTDQDIAYLAPRLASEGFAAALLLFYHQPLARLLRRIGIPCRIGPLSKWSSWFLLNRGVWQRRSRARHHESEYNLQLARKLAGGGPAALEPQIHLTAGQREIGARFRAQQAAGARAVVFVHPGCGGSALNWPPDSYAGLANQLADRTSCRVFVTGGPQDRHQVEAVVARLRAEVHVIAERYLLRDFLGVLSGGDLLIGPSTGPLHMAGALGLHVVGIYSPVPSQSIARWGPRGGRARALAPRVPCPARLVCFAGRCRHDGCMHSIAVDDVLAAATAALSERLPDAGPAGVVAG
jgi:ADP-heptose:LPS heptosyltransferase